MLQPDVYPLMQGLLDAGHAVLLETGGHVSVARVPPGVVRIVDVKCPGSGEAGRMHWENLALLGSRDEVKFVIGDRADYDYAKMVLAREGLSSRVSAILFSPVHGQLRPQTWRRGCWRTGWRCAFSCRFTSTIWGPATRGVWAAGRRRPGRVSARQGSAHVRTTACRRPPQRRPRFLHGGGHRRKRGIRPLRAHDRATASGTASSCRRRRRVASALGVARHLEIRSTCRPSAGRR